MRSDFVDNWRLSDVRYTCKMWLCELESAGTDAVI